MSASRDSKSVITIGAECGGPDTGPMSHIKVDLACALHAECRESFCPTIDQYALVLRISGTLDEFGPESIERIRRRRSGRYITADIVIPEAVWRPLTLDQSKRYLATRVREAVEKCSERLSRDREVIDVASLLATVDAGVARFLGDIGEPGKSPRRAMSAHDESGAV